MSDPEARPTPRPRVTQTIVGIVLAAQAVFAWLGLSGAADPGAALAGGSPLALGILVAFGLYALLVGAYLAALVVEARALRAIGMAAALAGLVVGGLRLAAGEPADALLFGMAIDGLIVYGLRRPDIRVLFPA